MKDQPNNKIDVAKYIYIIMPPNNVISNCVTLPRNIILLCFYVNLFHLIEGPSRVNWC